MSNAEVKKALNTEFRLSIVKNYVEQINADNYKSHTCSLKLDLLKYNLDKLYFECETSSAIELVEKRQNSIAKALRNLKR